MTSNVVLWTYVALLLAGGSVGFIKAKSQISLYTSLGFGLLIALSALGILSMVVAMVLIGLLAVFFGMRFSKGKKFMPAGLMTILSVAALVALLFLNR